VSVEKSSRKKSRAEKSISKTDDFAKTLETRRVAPSFCTVTRFFGVS